MEKSKRKHTQVYSECLLSFVVLCVLCCSTCLLLDGSFCHGALKGARAQKIGLKSIYLKIWFR